MAFIDIFQRVLYLPRLTSITLSGLATTMMAAFDLLFFRLLIFLSIAISFQFNNRRVVN